MAMMGISYEDAEKLKKEKEAERRKYVTPEFEAEVHAMSTDELRENQRQMLTRAGFIQRERYDRERLEKRNVIPFPNRKRSD
jgi:hypothetical protein